MERSWFLEPRFNSQGAKFHLVGSFINKFDTGRLFRELSKYNRNYNQLVVDCSQMTGIDGHGVHDLIIAQQSFEKMGVTLKIERVNPKFRGKFEEKGFGNRIDLPISYAEGATDVGSSADAPAS